MKQITQKTAIAAVSYKRGKSKGSKNAALKKGASPGKTAISGRAKPPYSVIPYTTIALPPGQGPPMSSGSTVRGASVSSSSHASRRTSSSRSKRLSRGK